ncbi:hypothetical protein B0H15DRAFT_244128 [Mycena belliarum]|uniref:CCHC-type domain-containing protein n=1 Tax=Mycena belliarum TaxID=1033014 RepID=A0AAD6U5D7_9AGAR|nr:hypothetical protein B0H15DRAFT_244128 [Mycena belliae]
MPAGGNTSHRTSACPLEPVAGGPSSSPIGDADVGDAPATSDVSKPPARIPTCSNCYSPHHMRWQCRKPLRCLACGEEGHKFSACPNQAPRRPRICYHCGKTGHWANMCPRLNPTGKSTCRKCYQPGHNTFECTNPPACYACGGAGHIASACPNPGPCRRCGSLEHLIVDCDHIDKLGDAALAPTAVALDPDLKV